MADWGTRRQFSFILVFILLLLAIAGLIYFTNSPEPTCFDGLQNQDELEVDCGGSCLKVCPVEVSDLIVHWSRVVKVREGVYDVAALVENPNPFGIESIDYRIKVHDEDNILIRDFNGRTYLNPGEKMVLFEPNINVGFRTPTTAFIEFSEPEWHRLIPARKPILSVGGKRFSNETQAEVRFTLSNDSLFDAGAIEAFVILFDERENAYAASRTLIEGLDSGEEKELFFTWPEPLEIEPFSIEIITRTDLVHDNIITEPPI